MNRFMCVLVSNWRNQFLAIGSSHWHGARHVVTHASSFSLFYACWLQDGFSFLFTVMLVVAFVLFLGSFFKKSMVVVNHVAPKVTFPGVDVIDGDLTKEVWAAETYGGMVKSFCIVIA